MVFGWRQRWYCCCNSSLCINLHQFSSSVLKFAENVSLWFYSLLLFSSSSFCFLLTSLFDCLNYCLKKKKKSCLIIFCKAIIKWTKKKKKKEVGKNRKFVLNYAKLSDQTFLLFFFFAIFWNKNTNAIEWNSTEQKV